MPTPTVATHAVNADDQRETRRLVRRAARYRARAILWRESGWVVAPTDTDYGRRMRVAYCGKHAVGDTVSIRTTAGGAAGFGGVQSCGSVWSCPVCSEKINAERQGELTRGLEGWLSSKVGGAVLFGTLTLQHRRGQSLAQLWDAIGPAWNRVTSGAGVAWNGSKSPSGYRGDKKAFGIAGYVRVVEVKHGVNGWHPHIHFLLFLEESLSELDRSQLEQRLYDRWTRALGKAGLRASREHGIDLRPVETAALGDYFAKGTYTGETTAAAAAFEVTGSHAKEAGKGGRTPFQILADVVALGDAHDLDLWHEWERASMGRRQLTWSRDMRAMLGLLDERTDEEIAEEDHGGDTVALLTAGDYNRMATEGHLTLLLEMAERPDRGKRLRAFLAEMGCLSVTDLHQQSG